LLFLDWHHMGGTVQLRVIIIPFSAKRLLRNNLNWEKIVSMIPIKSYGGSASGETDPVIRSSS
jgi:hypothetical protein